MRIQLEEAVHTERVCRIQVRPPLYASKCDGCGKVFQMKPFCNDNNLAFLSGTFEHCATDPETKKGMGNGFSAVACSFQCAHVIFTGAWRNIPQYKPFADEDIRLVRCELKITSYVVDEKAIREEWEKINQTTRDRIEWAEIVPR